MSNYRDRFASRPGATIFVAFSRVNYAVAVIGVTIWIVGVLGAVGDPVARTMDLRLLATAMAAVLVLAAFFAPSFVSNSRAGRVNR
jgi:uncharacterized membrane protein YccC